MFKVKMRLEGADELIAALRALPDALTKKVVERALMKAAQPIAADAKSRAPRKTGKLAAKIDVSAKLSKRQRRGRDSKGLAEAFVGASPARHAALLEFGTGPRRQKKTGRDTGQGPAKPFLRPAWESGKMAALDAIGEALWTEIEKAATHLGRKAAKAKK